MYRELGCGTLQYILPTRFIFRHSEQAHEAVADVAKYLRGRGVSTPLLVHCLSDTGCMSFQGLSIGTEVALLLLRGFSQCPEKAPTSD